jgi:hypothetical protein
MIAVIERECGMQMLPELVQFLSHLLAVYAVAEVPTENVEGLVGVLVARPMVDEVVATLEELVNVINHKEVALVVERGVGSCLNLKHDGILSLKMEMRRRMSADEN